MPAGIGRESGPLKPWLGKRLGELGISRDDPRLDPPHETLIYREEVTAIIGALADLVVETRRIRELLEDEAEDDEEGTI